MNINPVGVLNPRPAVQWPDPHLTELTGLKLVFLLHTFKIMVSNAVLLLNVALK